ncbi:LssY C-terminal domain-containing protein [Tabrizicola sp. BL-A-41-H6]|uniref:LssY C-terminal domain-containing protein n=1 Tax=Tabrizicola sp. BL-A-41-H6 TaxID=3421107 RepID=UPI003D663FDA
MALPTADTLTELLLPSLQSMGVWAYWAIGAAALLEAFFLTGMVFPGSILVDLGGVLVHRGLLDFVDLLWFVSIGSWVGSYGSFWFGRRLAAGKRGRRLLNPSRSPAFGKAKTMVERHGALGVLLGRLSGPVAGLVPFAAGLSGMPRRRFLAISALAAVPYAVLHIAIGYGASEVFSRLSPAFTREAVALAVVLLVLALIWYVLARMISFLPWVGAVLAATLRSMAKEPAVARWLAARPRLTAAVSSRLSRTGFAGLPLTLTIVALLALGALWVGSVVDYLSGDPIIRADRNIASLLHALQTPAGLRVATYVTAIGDGRAVTALLAAACLALWLRGERALVLGAVVATLGQSLAVSLLKQLFGRARPSLAHFTETTASFPSGHAAVSVAFFGFVAYALWRNRLVRLRIVLPIAGLTILSVGFSRIYLGEHYLSDVVNGFLLGAIWLVVGVAVSEALRMGRLQHTHPRHGPIFLTVLPFLAFAGFIVMGYEKPLAPVAAPTLPKVLASAQEAPMQPGFDPYAESLIGTQVEPVSMILIAPDAETVTAAFTKAGWDAPAPTDLPQLVEAAFAAWTNHPDPVAPITPYFRNGQPNDLAFQKPDATDSLRRRHHLRLWKTNFRLASGEALFLAAASFDDGLKWGLVHHISPDLDAERDVILKGLAQAGVLVVQSVVDGNGPLTGKDEFGDPWFSDGRIVIANVKPVR